MIEYIANSSCKRLPLMFVNLGLVLGSLGTLEYHGLVERRKVFVTQKWPRGEIQVSCNDMLYAFMLYYAFMLEMSNQPGPSVTANANIGLTVCFLLFGNEVWRIEPIPCRGLCSSNHVLPSPFWRFLCRIRILGSARTMPRSKPT